MTHFVTFAKEVDEDKVTPGVLGFIVFAEMALAVWALMKSMSKHMGKVDFKETPDEASGKETAAQGSAVRGATEGPSGPSGKASPSKG